MFVLFENHSHDRAVDEFAVIQCLLELKNQSKLTTRGWDFPLNVTGMALI